MEYAKEMLLILIESYLFLKFVILIESIMLNKMAGSCVKHKDVLCEYLCYL
jgi:hypothetical protein